MKKFIILLCSALTFFFLREDSCSNNLLFKLDKEISKSRAKERFQWEQLSICKARSLYLVFTFRFLLNAMSKELYLKTVRTIVGNDNSEILSDHINDSMLSKLTFWPVLKENKSTFFKGTDFFNSSFNFQLLSAFEVAMYDELKLKKKNSRIYFDLRKNLNDQICERIKLASDNGATILSMSSCPWHFLTLYGFESPFEYVQLTTADASLPFHLQHIAILLFFMETENINEKTYGDLDSPLCDTKVEYINSKYKIIYKLYKKFCKYCKKNIKRYKYDNYIFFKGYLKIYKKRIIEQKSLSLSFLNKNNNRNLTEAKLIDSYLPIKQ